MALVEERGNVESTPRSRILGTGSYAPSRVVSNVDLESIVDTSDGWIATRTGIRRRRFAADGETTSDLAAAASRRALTAAGLNVADLDLIIVGTVTPDQPTPSCATALQRKLGASDIPAFDIAAACAGFVYGLTIADQFIATGKARCVLVVGVELLSRAVNWSDRTTCVLFGDGAGAVVLGPSSMACPDDVEGGATPGILATQIFTDGSLADALCIPAGGARRPATLAVIEAAENKVHMDGQDVFRTAVKQLTASSAQVMKAAGLVSRDIDWVVPHQANMRIIAQVSQRLGYPLERFVLNLEEYGNTSSASIPIALDEAVRDGRVRRGQRILMCALGAGISWGAAVVRL
ncbi:MAG: ketoacyl-ACP synthase III [Deltaproteobacteria bacterium]|nr:ketoacyl-ACP synthase III [Deltaproteobacteria bacterium]